jgi:hypothetical protein
MRAGSAISRLPIIRLAACKSARRPFRRAQILLG